MALVIRGKSTCCICREVLTMDAEVAMFPPLIANARSPLRPFNDAAAHRRCLSNHPLGKLAEAVLEMHLDRVARGSKPCVVCQEAILTPDEYFSTGLLTEDTSTRLFDFNFLQFHTFHFALWECNSEFRSLVEVLQRSPQWEGPRIVFEPVPRWEASERMHT